MCFTILRGVEPLRSGAIGERLPAEEIERFVQRAMQVGAIESTGRERLETLAL